MTSSVQPRALDSAVARALALIGQPRNENCPRCGAASVHQTAILAPHTALSAALACNIDPQRLYRALRMRKKAEAA